MVGGMAPMMRRMLRLWLWACVLACVGPAALAGSERLGRADFANTCSAGVQGDFQDGVLLLHSMEFQQAESDFRRVEAGDPQCVIAAWGLALAETERSGADAPQKDLARGWSELEPWLGRRAGSAREQMYVDAVRAMYAGYADTPGDVRWHRYLAAMEAIRKQDADDVNASLFYAIGLVWTAGPGKAGMAQRRQALAILLPIFAAHPENPGAAHYIIHAADTPALASIALPAAREYAAIAPDSPHAQHMPSHIFNRLGDWKDSIARNEASAQVAAAWVQAGRGGEGDEAHALNNLEYSWLQLGETQQARGVIERIDALARLRGGDPWEPIDARIYYDVETHDWTEALALEPPSASKFGENFDVYWIHAVAEARLGRPTEARAALEDFRKSSAEWVGGHGWGDVLHLALAEADAWTVYAEGHGDAAVRELEEAERFEKSHPLYYADILPRPSSQMLGDLLLQMGRNQEACAAYRESLEVAPNTHDAIEGLQTCAAQGAGVAAR
jgi:tetratricopeptide (TPR) repeat protein